MQRKRMLGSWQLGAAEILRCWLWGGGNVLEDASRVIFHPSLIQRGKLVKSTPQFQRKPKMTYSDKSVQRNALLHLLLVAGSTVL